MKMFKSQTWQYEKMGLDGTCELFGVNVFNYPWESTGEEIKVKDPSYQQEHVMSVFRINLNGVSHTFAAGEFSNGVYGFYLFKY